MTVGEVAAVDPVDRYAQSVAALDRRLGDLERRLARPPGGASSPYVRKVGDTMTGGLSINTPGSGGLALLGTNNYQAWYNTVGTRIGYLQGTANGLDLASELGRFQIIGSVQLSGNNYIGWASWVPNNMWMQDATWLRIASSVYLATGTLGAAALSINRGGVISPGYTADIGGALALSGNIGFVPSNPTISAASYIVMPGGLHVSGGTTYIQGPLQARGGISNDSGTRAPGVNIQAPGSLGAWYGSQLQVIETSGAQHTALTLYTGPTAPIFRAYGPFGDRFDCLNNPNTAYCPINASAFTVQSSERVKHDIAEVADDALLALVGKVKTHTFVANARPMTMPVSERFRDLNARWIAHGKSPLTPTQKCYHGAAEPHDCANPRHWCLGAPGHPCPVARNDTLRFGLIAEHLHGFISEAVFYGEDEQPEGYDVDQVAAMAFGGVGALMRLVSRLQQRIDQLEQDHYPTQRMVA